MPRTRLWIITGVVVAAVIGAIVAIVVVVTRDDDDSSSSNNNKSEQSSAAAGNNPTVFPSLSPSMTTPSQPITNATTVSPSPLLPISSTSPTDSPTFTTFLEPSMHPSLEPTVQLVVPTGEILVGQSIGYDYFYCNAPQNNNNSNKQIVLLHGASFNKQVWKSTGILDQLCDSPTTTVVAMDFPVSSDRADIEVLLDALQDDGMIIKPVMLVTPSASGFTIVDWIVNGDVSYLPEYVSTWVPVAPVSLSLASDAQLSALVLPILAIYGNRDSGGERYSRRLEQLAGATVVELQGGHAVYRQSPNEFVEELMKF